MTKHIVIILAVMLLAGAGYALPQTAARATWATEAELLSAPGSAGYPVEDSADGDDSMVPLCDCDTDEGEDGFDDGDGTDPGDGGDDGPGHDGDQGADDDEPGC